MYRVLGEGMLLGGKFTEKSVTSVEVPYSKDQPLPEPGTEIMVFKAHDYDLSTPYIGTIDSVTVNEVEEDDKKKKEKVPTVKLKLRVTKTPLNTLLTEEEDSDVDVDNVEPLVETKRTPNTLKGTETLKPALEVVSNLLSKGLFKNNETYNNQLNLFARFLGLANIQIVFAPDIIHTVNGEQRKYNGAHIDGTNFIIVKEGLSDKELLRTILHELTHIKTSRILRTPVDQLSSAEKEYQARVNHLYENFMNSELKDRYPNAAKSAVEFISDLLSDNDLYAEMSKVSKSKLEGGNLIKKIIDWIVDLFYKVTGQENRILSDLSYYLNNITRDTLLMQMEDPTFKLNLNAKKYSESNQPDQLYSLLNSVGMQIKEDQRPRNNFKFEPTLVSPLEATANPAASLEELPGAELNAEGTLYQGEDGNTYERLSHFMDKNFMTSKKLRGESELTREEYIATQVFTSQGKSTETDRAYKDGKSFSFPELVAYLKSEIQTSLNRGKAAHKILEILLLKDLPNNKAKADQLTAELRELLQGKDGAKPLRKKDFEWINEDFGTILKILGINYRQDKEGNVLDVYDDMYSEITTYSPLLKIATTIDGVFEDAGNGDLHLFDWKTGALFSDQYVNRIMQYAASSSLRDSKISRAKMDVVLRAFMIKEHLPHKKFRQMAIGHLNKTTKIDKYPIELQSYLDVLAKYLQENDPVAYEKALADGLLDERNYWGQVTVQADTKKYTAGDVETRKRRILARIQEITSFNTPALIEQNKTLSDELAMLTRLYTQLGGKEGENLLPDYEQDISFVERWLSNLKDLKSAVIKPFSKLYLDGKMRVTKRHREMMDEYEAKIFPVIQEYYENNGLANLMTKATFGLLNSIPGLAGLNKSDLYSFM